jgi:hypothetical protein
MIGRRPVIPVVRCEGGIWFTPVTTTGSAPTGNPVPRRRGLGEEAPVARVSAYRHDAYEPEVSLQRRAATRGRYLSRPDTPLVR